MLLDLRADLRFRRSSGTPRRRPVNMSAIMDERECRWAQLIDDATVTHRNYKPASRRTILSTTSLPITTRRRRGQT